ncbi:hypothetical protein CMT41_16630 [Colwellia sp. MT41]|uniref:hypothetical protein n=1 Tax=Colwellia sp. MT41 TaxID=58049 RepID=UPI000717A705|nr:hypothetical protein [Colwellia sp. MT41]ALO36173.1 hypothetical protein CMT41_16630 [Colwellia sp. MT41]
MYQKITCTIILTTLLTACIIPISSSCSRDQTFDNGNNGFPPKGQDCSTADAAIYLASALYNEVQNQPEKEAATSNPPQKNAKCSHLIGKSQKECIHLKDDAYDPLDEL